MKLPAASCGVFRRRRINFPVHLTDLAYHKIFGCVKEHSAGLHPQFFDVIFFWSWILASDGKNLSL